MHRLDRSPSSTAVAREPDVANHFLIPAFCFSIDALPDAGVMARVLEQFAKRDLLPTRLHSDVIESDAMQIDIQIVGLAETLGQDVARCLRSIVGVHGVLTAGKAVQSGRRLDSL